MKYLIPFFLCVRIFADTFLVNYPTLTNYTRTNNTRLNNLSVPYSVDSIAALAALPTKDINNSSALTSLSVHVRGYYSKNGQGGGMFTLCPTSSLPAGVTVTNYGTCFKTFDAPTYYWVRMQRDNLSIYDFGAYANGAADDSVRVQNAFNSVGELTFPVNTTTYLTGAIVSTNYINLHVRGNTTGSCVFRFNAGVKLDGGGTISANAGSTNAMVAVYGGDVDISGLKFVGDSFGTKYGVLIDQTAAISKLKINNNIFEALSYAILREAAITNVIPTDKYVYTSYIGENVITNIYSAGIAWEPVLSDGPLDIKGNKISNVHYTGVGFAGFGISVAGWNYDNFYDVKWLKKISILDNAIDISTEGIHIEYAADVHIGNNNINNIKAQRVGATPYGIVAYGCKRIAVTGNSINSFTNDPAASFAIYIGLGINGVNYTVSPDDITVAANHTHGGGIAININGFKTASYPDAFFPSAVNVVGNTIYDGQLLLYGRGQYIVQNNFARAPWGISAIQVSPVLQYAPYLTGEYLNYYSFINNTAINPVGSPSYALTVDNFNNTADKANLQIYGFGNNFAFPAYGPVQSIGRVFHVNTGKGTSAISIPYGIEFALGDMIIDDSQSPPEIITIKTAGSVNIIPDNTAAIPATNYPYGRIGATAGQWIKATYSVHTPGQRLNILGKSAVIKDIYYDSTLNLDMMVVVDEATGLPMDLTSAYPGSISEYATANFYKPTYAGTALVATVNAGTTYSFPITLPGLTTTVSDGNYPELIVGPNLSGSLIAWARTTGLNTATIYLYNPTGGNIAVNANFLVKLRKYTVN